MVNKLIAKGQYWKEERVRELFQMEIADCILRTPISLLPREDKLVWPFRRDGEYTVKTRCHAAKSESYLAEEAASSSLEDSRDLWKEIWNMKGNRRDKPTIEFDPEIEKTLKKNRSRVKAQRALQFDQEEANSDEGASEKFSEEELVEENSEEEIQDNMADNANNQRRTLSDYTNPTTASCGSSIVWPTVDANNFELKPALVQLVQQN
ncbi:hypothetical protein PIB30_097597 [Stylosanthes scabra]|uniref:Uncharacterized protein n=1 Tax=Stylosanthes scabra TaxID=79078 RepID=A0ABU6V057_9FABA|nr:hypothetical protein [Stylosanthes scabra]